MKPVTPQPSSIIKTQRTQVGYNPELVNDREKKLAEIKEKEAGFSSVSQNTGTVKTPSPIEQEIPVVETLTSILESAAAQAASLLPFGADYTSLNKLKYIKQLIEDAKKNNDRFRIIALQEKESELKEYFVNAINKLETPWIKRQCNRFKEKNRQIPNSQNIDSFISFLINHTSLPEKYADYNDHAQFAERQFPSAGISGGKDQFEFAHLFRIGNDAGGILASHVPHKIDDEKDEQNTQAFLEMLWRREVSAIVVLGGKADRLPYANHTPSDITLFSTSEKNNVITLTDLAHNLQTEINRIGFSVEDETPLNLSNQDAKRVVSDIFERAKTKTVLVHCDSGVGRTGMLNAIIHFLKAYEEDESFRNNCDDLSLFLRDYSDRVEDIKKYSAVFYNKAAEIVAKLREARFTIQTEKQFQHVLSQTLICLAVKNNLEEDEIASLRKSLNIAIKEKGFEGSFYSTPSSSAATSTNTTPSTSQSNLATLRFLGGAKPSGFASKSPRTPTVVTFDQFPSADSLSDSSSPRSFVPI